MRIVNKIIFMKYRIPGIAMQYISLKFYNTQLNLACATEEFRIACMCVMHA